MEATLDVRVEESSKRRTGVEENKNLSFAEQYLETPVYAGKGVKDYEMAKFTATACTFRGIPVWDDF